MECVRDLRADYAHINTMLDVLEASVARLNNHSCVDQQMLRGILRFFREFAHGFHGLKVEILIFPVIARKGTAAEMEATVPLPSQYAFAGALLEAVSRLVAQLPDSIDALTSSARQYLDHSRRYFPTEHSLLERFLARALTPAEDEALVREFARLERDRIGPTGREWYTQMILDYRDIVSAWGRWPDTVPRSPT